MLPHTARSPRNFLHQTIRPDNINAAWFGTVLLCMYGHNTIINCFESHWFVPPARLLLSPIPHQQSKRLGRKGGYGWSDLRSQQTLFVVFFSPGSCLYILYTLYISWFWLLNLISPLTSQSHAIRLVWSPWSSGQWVQKYWSIPIEGQNL